MRQFYGIFTGMQIVLIILSLGILVGIIYFAFSPKSSPLLKRVAFIALGVIALALVICGIFLIMGPAEETGIIPIPGFHEPPAQEAESRVSVELVVFILIFLLIMGIIIYSAIKEQQKKSSKLKTAEKRRSIKD